MRRNTAQSPSSLSAALAVATLCLVGSEASADSVAQVGTSVRISRATAALIDPQGRPGGGGMGTDTAVQAGDILTFVVHFTPVPNGATRGLGGYITVYVPRNTEVVGGRIIDAQGNTIAPFRGGLASDGAGPRGANTYGTDTMGNQLEGGSLSQLYADTGMFFSIDARTERVPYGPGVDEFISITNGVAMLPNDPTGIGNIANILGVPGTTYAHNQWDWIQALGFGVGGGGINTRGQGDTPDMYGSAVAGPLTWYPYEASYEGDLATMPYDQDLVVASQTEGPWERIQTFGAEIGRRGNAPPMPDPGIPTRIGIPAVDPGTGELLGRALHGDAPLPAFNPASPADPFTRALRFAVGELVVGEAYLAEFSVRVRGTPLDPVTMSDVVCAEVFGGDASARDRTGNGGGKDNPWRYFLPAPACVSLNLLFDLDVDKLVAVVGDQLVYTITVQNLSTQPQTDVVIRHCYTAGDLSFVSSTPAGTAGDGTGCADPAAQDDVSWTVPTLAPGELRTYTLTFDVQGTTNRTTLSRAIYISTELPDPGFQTVAFTNVDTQLVIVDLAMTATPSIVPTPPADVHYVATVGNRGTGTAGADQVTITLPAPFTYVSGSTIVDGTPVGGVDPTIVVDAGTGNELLTFTAAAFGLPDLAPGSSMILELDATVPGGTAEGAYRAGIETWYAAARDVSDARSGLAQVIVGAQSDVPTLDEPLSAGATLVRGSTTEPDGTVIRVFVAGVEVGSATASGGRWSVTVPALLANQAVSATAEAPGEIESDRAAEVTVQVAGSVTECNDGADNDGDGLIDLADPDCASDADTSETHIPSCADGLDNDGDGAIDFGSDPGCRSLIDDTEDSVPECADGVDNDGNGSMDFPDDPGCSSADDPYERALPACADGLDNDGDGATDYPADNGCENALDGDETPAVVTDAGVGDAGVDGGAVVDAGATPDAGGSVDGGSVEPFDPGGVEAPKTGGGCCAVAPVASGSPGNRGPAILLGALALLAGLGRRRRRPRRR